MSPICRRHKGLGQPGHSVHPSTASLRSSSGDGWASPWVASQCQTYLDTLRGAEDIDDSLGHIFGFETLYMFIGGSCLLRVLVMKFEGEACLHRFWRDALGQRRGPAQEPRLPHPTPIRGRASGGGEKGWKLQGPGFTGMVAPCPAAASSLQSCHWQ